MNYQVLKIESLTPFQRRDVRDSVVEKLKERFQAGFNPARPLSVIQQNGTNLVADGNHRLKLMQEIGIEEAPCVIYPPETDPYELSIRCNNDEDTYAKEDLFDKLDTIRDMKEKGRTISSIAFAYGESESKVKNYSTLLSAVDTDVLVFSKNNQVERVSKEDTSVSFNFTEGWFRNSGIYAINPDHQMKFIEWFIHEEKCKAASNKIQAKTEYYKNIEEQLAIVETDLNPDVDGTELKAAILRGEYNTKRLLAVIARMNEGAKNKAVFGMDALEGLKQLPDNSVDMVLTDPPYGVDYIPSRKTGNPGFKDGKEHVLEYLDGVFAEIKRVCKENAHIYCFSGWANLFEFRALLKKYFDVPDYNLIWVKNNHTPCDFKSRYASKNEQIIFCKMPNGDERKLNADVSPDTFTFSIPQNKIHDCQKPLELLKHLIENSTGQGEVVLDPFSGSGSTLLAAAKSGRYYIGFEAEEKYESHFKRNL